MKVHETIRIDEDVHNFILECSKKEFRTKSNQINFALRQWMESQKSKQTTKLIDAYSIIKNQNT